MIVQMDKMSAPSLQERVQRLYKKAIELENKRRKSAQARIPSDPSAWQQIRENYEAIILEDHAFSEQHNIEYALWQLHYKRIEEFRTHYSAALSSTGSTATQSAKGPARPEQVTKIRMQFKTFLSEATGFYHDLILKIRAKYGLPLGYFSEDSETQIVMDKDGKKSTEVKKGLVSCHRCLIYLGDLARYKGLYGEGDSKTREYAAASSYYLQAASLWPSSGNPHHQLAILASYSGDELVAVYRYFRSLAVESPFSTARDNLIVAFEKNRQSYSQLPGESKASIIKESPVRFTSKGRGKGEVKLVSKDANKETGLEKETASNAPEMYKTFCIRFVRLNGILFTRTSLETFSEVLTSVSSGLSEFLSSGPEEELNFGADTVESSVAIVRLVSILIFTVHNSKRETEGQTYAEIVQRAVLLQNAFTAIFELMGHIINRCVQLHDPSSSYLLPGILVFVEWLACCPDVVAGSDADEKQAAVRSSFWNYCIAFLNKILSTGHGFVEDDEDESCFFHMSRYEEGETENRLALSEDFELRGFLPLLPAQTILDFSRKHSFGNDGNKEKKARIKRILAAGKALANVIKIDCKTVCFDSRLKKFVVGVESLEDIEVNAHSSRLEANGTMQETQTKKTMNLGLVQQNLLPYLDGEDEDEVIVFKPIVTEKRNEAFSPKHAPYDSLKKLDHSISAGDPQCYSSSLPAPLENLHQHPQVSLDVSHATTQIPLSVGNVLPQNLHPVKSPHPLKWLPEEEISLSTSLTGLKLMENGHVAKHEMPGNMGISHLPARSISTHQSFSTNTSGLLYGHSRVPEAVIPSKIDAVASLGVIAENLAVKNSSALSTGSRKSPVSRPGRHLGPPPGFNPVPPKQVTEPISGSDLMSDNPLMDDYSWLDGYQPSSMKGSGFTTSLGYPYIANPQFVGNNNGLNGTVNFPFPGKQVPPMQLQAEMQKGWQDYQNLEHLKLQREQQQLQQKQKQLINENQQFATMPEQYQGQSIWTGRYFV